MMGQKKLTFRQKIIRITKNKDGRHFYVLFGKRLERFSKISKLLKLLDIRYQMELHGNKIDVTINRQKSDSLSTHGLLSEQKTEIERLFSLFESTNIENLRMFYENKQEREAFQASLVDALNQLREQQVSQNNELAQLHEQQVMQNKDIFQSQSSICSKLELLQNLVRESIWANIFADSVKNSWLEGQPISPGRWAMGYPELYLLFRVIDAMKPKRILELGLGESTKVIASYVRNSDDDIKHIVVEHDEQWADYFKHNFSLPEKSEIRVCPIQRDSYLDDERVVMYENFEDIIANEKFDFICVDGPFGFEAIKYSRVDILKVLPTCLESSWAILIDDCDRNGEKETIKLLEERLTESAIGYVKGALYGEKGAAIIASEDNLFLTSL